MKMMYNAVRAVIIMTAYLVIYIVLFAIKAPHQILAVLFLLSPFLVVYTVYTVLKDQRFKYPELGPQEEWGYFDRPRETIYPPVCYPYMEPFQIEISILDDSKTLLVYPGPNKGTYDVFEDRRRLGIVYRDRSQGGIWCSKDPIPTELVNLIGDGIDAYEN